MHESVYDFVTRTAAKFELTHKSVLEVGSYNVNGSVRDIFSGDYIGIDINEGPGVDTVLSAHQLVQAFDVSSFDVVLCCEMLEHDPHPQKSMREMGKVLKSEGYLIVTTRAPGFPEHNNPDLWRFMKDGMIELVRLSGCQLVEITNDPQVSGWFVVAKKE